GAAVVKRIEVAVAGHRDAHHGRLQRIAGDLRGRHAVVVAQVGREADVLGDVVLAVDVQRAALDRGQHVHLVGAVAGGVGGLRVEAGAQGVAAAIGGVPVGVHRLGVAVLVEHGGSVGVALDQAAVAVVAAPLAGGRAAVLREARVTVAAEPAVARPDAVFIVVLAGDGDRAALAGEAHDEVVVFLGTVAV